MIYTTEVCDKVDKEIGKELSKSYSSTYSPEPSNGLCIPNVLHNIARKEKRGEWFFLL
jgi:hypothetical protein